MGRELDSDGNSKRLFLNNFVNILQDFNDLRHNNDLFDNLLQDVRNFNKFLFVGNNFDWDLNDSVNNL